MVFDNDGVDVGDLVDFVVQLFGDGSWGSGGEPDRTPVDSSRVVVALRGRGAAKWREGYLNLTPGAEGWRRHRVLPGRRMSLPGLRIGPDRPTDFFEPWWQNSGARVFSATAGDRELEIAALPGGVEALVAAARRSGERTSADQPRDNC